LKGGTCLQDIYIYTRLEITHDTDKGFGYKYDIYRGHCESLIN